MFLFWCNIYFATIISIYVCAAACMCELSVILWDWFFEGKEEEEEEKRQPKQRMETKKKETEWRQKENIVENVHNGLENMRYHLLCHWFIC